jgi:hypothetical protein
MKPNKQLSILVLMLASLTAGVWAQTQTASNAGPESRPATAAPVPSPAPITAADIQALKDALAAQQKQIQALQQQLQLKNESQSLSTVSEPASVQPVAASQVAEVSSSVATQQDASAGASPAPQEAPEKPSTNPMESPVTIHFRGITITPGGFVAAEFVRRSRALGADLPTPLNSVTMPGASQSQLSEFFGSGRQSRPTVYINGRLNNVDFSSYVSADFLSAGVTSTATQTNSYTLRLRQAWGQVKFDNGWSLLGGQMWSLLTEGKASIAPSDDAGRTNDARPATIDPGYNAGFTFARQYGLRVTKNFSDRVAFAVAIENAQGTATIHNNGDNFLIGEAGASNSYNTTGTYTFNPSPDIIAKIAFDPGFGHYEIFGLYDRFRDRIFPCGELTPVTPPTTPATYTCNGVPATAASAIGAYNASKNGGGFGANARWAFDHKHIIFGLHGFGGSGVGRYGAAQLSDLTFNANGTIALLKGLQGLTTLEWRGKKLDVYFYTGAEYAGRSYGTDPLGKSGAPGAGPNMNIGYGNPNLPNYGCYVEQPPTVNTGFTPTSLSNCTQDTRALIEGTGGFWYRFYNGPRGKFQFGAQYSYVNRQTWSGGNSPGVSGGLAPQGLDNMVFTSFRYYLP